MGDCMIISVNYFGETKLLSVTSVTCFDEINAQITSKWAQLGAVKFGIRCDDGNISNICLDSQEDFVSLKVMCELYRVRIVHAVLVVDEESGKNKSLEVVESQSNKVSSGFQIRSDDCTMLEELPDGKCDGKLFAVASRNNITSYCLDIKLLSDGWEEFFMSGNGNKFYGDAFEFRVALIKYCSKTGFRFKYMRNGSSYIYAVCYRNLDRGCRWYVKAKLFESSESIFVYNADLKHTCSEKMFRKSISCMLTPRIIANLMMPYVKKKALLCAKDVVDAIKIGYGFGIPYWKANRAACIAKQLVYGEHVDSNDQMFYYCKALLLTNPGSVVQFEAEDSTHRFKRVFIALNACIKGFKGCIPLLFVDGTFLRGRSKGILLVAIGKDGNRGLFPFAFALVSAENTDNWAWFLKHVQNCVEHEKRVFYFSDRNSGLMAAFPLVFREPVHFFYLYHLLSNLKVRFSGGVARENKARYHSLFKECAYELDREKVDLKIQEFKSLGGKKAIEFLSQLPLEKWCIAYAPVLSRFGEMTSNAAESFNSWLLAARTLPITKIFDWMRSGIGHWFVERSTASKRWAGIFVPCKQIDWNVMTLTSLKWNINVCPGGLYEVLSTPTAIVNLQLRICSCHQWESTGFPCVHAVSVIRSVRDHVLDDVEGYYLSTTYRAMYSSSINQVCETLIKELKAKIDHP